MFAPGTRKARRSAMSRAIVRHKSRWTAVLRLRASGTMQGKQLADGTVSRWRLKIVLNLERWTRRRLIRLPAKSSDEAAEKVLYLMAAMIAGNTKFSAEEIGSTKGSIAPFRSELERLFRSEAPPR